MDDDSYHFIVAPPVPDAGPGGQSVFFQANEGTGTDPTPSGIFEGCVIPNVGYDIEVQMPWNLPWFAQMASPASGAVIGFDFAVDVGDGMGDRVQTFGYLGPAPTSGAQNQCVVIGEPEAQYCDDRSCCTPTLQ
jgi:hypothetical protein